MKFNYDINTVHSLVGGEIRGLQVNSFLTSIHYDTRLFEQENQALFICLTAKRDGKLFIPLAYEKGCRTFMVQGSENLVPYEDATYLIVKDVLLAVQQLAIHHRSKFDIPVIGITGSFAKTIIKEWLFHCLKDHFCVVRSPKSFNSQLGVALSVLQINKEHTLGIFEAGISTTHEMENLEAMIKPTLGIFTGLGNAHDNGFENRIDKLDEKTKLFSSCRLVVSEKYQFSGKDNRNWSLMKLIPKQSQLEIDVPEYGVFKTPYKQGHQLYNLLAVLETLKALQIPVKHVRQTIQTLPQLAMRMEVIQGKNNNLFINDSYGIDSFNEAISFLNEIANDKEKLIFIGITQASDQTSDILSEIRSKAPTQRIYFVANKSDLPQFISFETAKEILSTVNNSAILIKGQFGSGIAQIIASQILRTHPTTLKISRQSLRNNLTKFKKLILPETKLMVMVKAAAYGVGAFEMAVFLEREGVDYLGVAFPDEGVNLRKLGVKLPIMVMNTPESAFYDIVQNNLEPAIFSLKQLDLFTAELIRMNKSKYPIHIKIETGMNRLGFRESDLDQLITYLSSQPEVWVKSVYSHLAESGNSDQSYTLKQLNRFDYAVERLEKTLTYQFDKHICNTDGIINYKDAHYDMVRLGIGLLGYAKLPGLEQALSLQTEISKINHIETGESLGYDRSYLAETPKKIAVLPIGYADGFRRLFGNGKGSVIIQNSPCPILGNVCMDMCFADVTHLNEVDDTQVELIGENITVYDWASWSQTIPYEVITSLSTRISRIWIE